MTAAIVVESLGKRYRVSRGAVRPRCRTLRDDLVSLASVARRRLTGGPHGGNLDEFWSLRGGGGAVRPGEGVGIMGRNGAGKSTLLKVLSRITRPTAGEVRLRGRVGSLLEVRTGVHPELTGRENIYLN